MATTTQFQTDTATLTFYIMIKYACGIFFREVVVVVVVGGAAVLIFENCF